MIGTKYVMAVSKKKQKNPAKSQWRDDKMTKTCLKCKLLNRNIDIIVSFIFCLVFQ